MRVMSVFLMVSFVVDFTLVLNKIIHSGNFSSIFLVPLAIPMIEAISHHFTLVVFLFLSKLGS